METPVIERRSSFIMHPMVPILSRLLFGVVLVLGLTRCGGGARIDVKGDNPVIGSQFPTTILIPKRYGGDKAYIQTASPPLLGVLLFHLDTFPPPMRSQFFEMNRVIQGIPDGLVMEEDRDIAFVTTSGEVEGVFVFNPAKGFQPVTSYSYTGIRFVLPKPAADSEGNVVTAVRPVFTSGAALVGKKLYISTSNYTQVGSNPVCAPGTVRIMGFEPDADPPYFLPPDGRDIVVTSDFNPTEVTPFTFTTSIGNDYSKTHQVVLVTNTGVLAIRNDTGVPLTQGSVDVLDTVTDCIVAKYPLDLGAPSFAGIAIVRQTALNGQPVYRGYVGSAAYNHVYELDLTGLERFLMDGNGECPEITQERILRSKVLASADNPMLATRDPANTSNLTYQVVVGQDHRAFATGFNSGTLAVFGLETTTTFDEVTGSHVPVPSGKTPSGVIQVTDPMPSLNETSPGPVAVRPGIPCDVAEVEDCFHGPDVFVVTGTPIGEVRMLRTY